MNLRSAIAKVGSQERALQLLDDFERMGIMRDSLVSNVISRIANDEVHWNVRVGLISASRSAHLGEVADSLPSLLSELLGRALDFEKLQIIESAWWMLSDDSTRLGVDELVELGNRTLKEAAKSNAGNLQQIISAVAEAIVERGHQDGAATLSDQVTRWLAGLDRDWLFALRSNASVTPERERFYRLATGADIKASRHLLSQWLQQVIRG